MATLLTTLHSSSSNPALILPTFPPLTLTHAQFAAATASLQHRLAQSGLSPTQAVTLALPNSLSFAAAFLAVAFQRAIAAPLNASSTQDEFAFNIKDIESALVLVPRGAVKRGDPAVRAAKQCGAAIAECYWDGLEVLLEVKARGKLGNAVSAQRPRVEDVALVLHTSGTTGKPKKVPLSHANLARSMQNIMNTYQLGTADRTLLVMPLFHVHGLLAGLLAPLLSEGSVIIPCSFSASEFWDHFITHKANWYTAVPTIHQIMLKQPRPKQAPKIRFIRSCSSPLSPKTFQELESAFNAPVLQAYAMTEAAHQMTSNPLPPGKRYPGSVGIGQGVEVRILDVDGKEVSHGGQAEICVRGGNVTSGYMNNPDANKSSFTADGFFRTGDQGKIDENGHVVITGRIKELINKGGEKISPVEIDNVIAHYSGVAEAVSFAIEDETFGQVIGVAIVKNKGADVDVGELKEWMRGKVARHKMPDKVSIPHRLKAEEAKIHY